MALLLTHMYDPCVANKDVNGKQMAVIWHVGDLKVSHIDENENSKFAEWMKTIYGEKLTVHRRKNSRIFRHGYGLVERWTSHNKHD